MKVCKEFSLEMFKPWQGGKDTKNTIIEHGKAKEFDFLLNELYPDGLTETEVNDLLWFEEDWIYESIGIEIEDQSNLKLEIMKIKLYVVLEHLEGVDKGLRFWTRNTTNNTHSREGELWYKELAFTNSTKEAVKLSNNFPQVKI